MSAADATQAAKRRRTGWLREEECSLAEFKDIVEQPCSRSEYPLASEVVSGVLVYDQQALPLGDDQAEKAVMAEWADALADGPGVICIRGAFAGQMKELDAVTEAFNAIIDEERASGTAKGDHFAKAGANSRIWNALEKVAVHSPDAFAAYYSNPIIALASHCWLGPNYQVTSQVNVVRPGGEAQAVHRDYHLGFTTNSSAEKYPAQVHAYLSPMLTLQGAVAHCDMPLESGPTLFLPHSQKYDLGYLSFRQQEFKDYFAQHSVQVPLAKGDVVFFNPALFHAAGSNTTTDIHRIGNLLQVSSAMGRAMETVDRARVSMAIYPSLLEMANAPGFDARRLKNAIAASAEGYSFPTNLDLDQPLGGLAPETQAELLARAVAERWDEQELRRKLGLQDSRRRSQ